MAALTKPADPNQPSRTTNSGPIHISDLDLSELVGREITLYTDQYPGYPMKCRAVLAEAERLVVDHSDAGRVGGLVPNQQVKLRVSYRQQDVFLHAVLKHHAGGGYTMILSGQVEPLNGRQFHRLPVVRPVRLSIFPGSLSGSGGLSRHRWLETTIANICAGGAAIRLVSQLQEQSYLLLSIDLEIDNFPALVVGQVRHSNLSADHGYETGVRFLTPSMIARHLPMSLAHSLPAAVTEYKSEIIDSIDNQLCAWMHQSTSNE